MSHCFICITRYALQRAVASTDDWTGHLGRIARRFRVIETISIHGRRPHPRHSRLGMELAQCLENPSHGAAVSFGALEEEI